MNKYSYFIGDGGVSLKEVKMAIPTNGKKGIKDTVSEVLGRAITFTIIDFKEGSIDNMDVLVNPALSSNMARVP